ncbi:gamete antigen 27/25 [Plasmodium brasilianum]|uniref:Gamete antigen 27/25 (G27/25) n=2 Tax=Plasmodium (Plasmodium) TaxID=418103 RepID=A0A1A8X9B7_PLAMA|nr:gamete antigen 27/25, putative [Plasmodium malariae]KAI4834582.1 gamete antigen 27/25 [Plasmodium brasilianum]SBT01202.1 gamete antigen 27/25 (G27/25) [Plasmodium malariae]SCP03118.1 gamete antigen 27/25, putative [Plasmodium malariae]
MNIYTFLQIQIFIRFVLIKGGSVPWTKQYITWRNGIATVHVEYHPPYEYKYKNIESCPVSVEVKKLGNVEFHATLDALYNLKYLRISKEELFDMIQKGAYIPGSLSRFQQKYEYSFKDEISKKHCISRIKKRLNFIVIEGILSDDEYCEEVKKVLWIEQRVDEEISVILDKLESKEEKDRMCRNEVEIKDLISKLEKAKALKLSEGMIENTLSTIEDFLLDIVRTYKGELPSKDAYEKKEGKHNKPNEHPKENATTHKKI